MKTTLSENITLFEHRFWLQILGDHSRFIHDALSPDEKEKVETAEKFIVLFDELLKEARKNLSGSALTNITQKAFEAAKDIRGLKLQIIQEHLVEKVKIHLTPTFINHMVNEVEEYLRLLSFIMQGQAPLSTAIYNHMLWLPDGAGHASAINARLDKVEKPLKKISNNFAENFDNMHIKAIELCGYMRTGLAEFPALNKLSLDASKEMTLFMGFLKELEGLVSGKEALGTLVPLMLDHMYREECYYLTKLSQISEIKAPECDPTKPRTTA